MEYFSREQGSIPAFVRISRFGADLGACECHLMVCPTEHADVDVQLDWVQRAYDEALASLALGPETALWRRFFCSDVAGQAAALAARPFSDPRAKENPCAVSWVRQSPAPPAKIMLWAYHVGDATRETDKQLVDSTLTWKRGELAHQWTVGMTCPGSTTAGEQTRGIFRRYDVFLHDHCMSLARNVLRTWLFVRDIDADYQDVVTARREFFHDRGLTPDTHFIASTGIEGAAPDPAARIAMDAYAVDGLRPEQVRFLAAPDCLGPAHAYGVTFERGTSVDYRDRRQAIISGTASIDPNGEIVHAGDVVRQLDRALLNVEALLGKADATLRDLCFLIAYVREPNDIAVVRKRLQARCGAVPLAVVAAPICRPGWLVEIEGNAVVRAVNPELPAF